MSKGILVTFTPDGLRTDKRIDRPGGPTLEELQEALGGYAERIQVRFSGQIRYAYVDEEAPLKGGKLNTYATTYYQEAFPERRVKALRGNIAIWVPDDPKVSRFTRKAPKKSPLSELLRTTGAELIQLADDLEQDRGHRPGRSSYALEALEAICKVQKRENLGG